MYSNLGHLISTLFSSKHFSELLASFVCICHGNYVGVNQTCDLAPCNELNYMYQSVEQVLLFLKQLYTKFQPLRKLDVVTLSIDEQITIICLNITC